MSEFQETHVTELDPVTQDLVMFASLVNASVQQNGSPFPARQAAQGLEDAWRVLAGPEDANPMPALQERAAAYLAALGLPIEQAAQMPLPMGVIERIAPLLMRELDIVLPDEHRNTDFVLDVSADISSIATFISSKRRRGREILAGVRWVLGTN